jgi:FkbM family methyltransferase
MTTQILPSHAIVDEWQRFSTKLRFKFVLPRVRTATIAGIKLDVSPLSPVMKNIIMTGRYEAPERSLVARALTPDDTVLELGGAIGFIGLFCRRVIGVRHVTSVEANPATLAMLRRNYELNGLEPDVIHAAAAAEDGELDLNVGGEFWENTVTGTSNQTVRVPALSLESLFKRMPQPPTALVCDIEGAEQYLDLHRLPATLTKIIIELHPAIIGKARTDAILLQLANQGFVEKAEDDGTYLLMR